MLRLLTGLKFIGFVLIGAAGIFTSAKILSNKDQNVERTAALAELVSTLRTRIDALCLPIPDILSQTDPKILTNCGYDSDDLPKSSDELISKCTFAEDEELYKIFSEFTRALGKDYKKEEIAKCKLIEDELSKLIKKRKEEREKGRKTVPALCLCISAGIIILLI